MTRILLAILFVLSLTDAKKHKKGKVKKQVNRDQRQDGLCGKVPLPTEPAESLLNRFDDTKIHSGFNAEEGQIPWQVLKKGFFYVLNIKIHT